MDERVGLHTEDPQHVSSLHIDGGLVLLFLMYSAGVFCVMVGTY